MERTENEILLQQYSDVNRRLSLAQEQLAIANQKLKEYEEKAQKAEKASKMKSLFLANMSHEIRTPLNAIEGFSRVLVETDSQEDRMKFFEIIESNNNRLQSLVNEILDLSRVEAGEITMKKSNTDLNQLCDSIKNLFKFRCPDTLKLVWKKPTQKMIPDKEKLLAYVKANNMPEFVKTKEEVDWAAYKKECEISDGRAVNVQTGELLPEDVITIEEEPGSFTGKVGCADEHFRDNHRSDGRDRGRCQERQKPAAGLQISRH